VQKPDFEEEVASGDTRRALAALRDLLAAELAVKTGSGVASVARVLLEVLRDISKLPSEEPGRSIADELKEMRKARLSLNARGQPRVKRQGGREREHFPRQKGSWHLAPTNGIGKTCKGKEGLMGRNGKNEPEFTPGAVRVVEDLGMTVADVEQLGFRVVEHWSCVPAVSERDAYAISKRQAMISQQREDERRRHEAERERQMAEFAARYPVARGVPAVEGLSAVEQVLLAARATAPGQCSRICSMLSWPAGRGLDVWVSQLPADPVVSHWWAANDARAAREAAVADARQAKKQAEEQVRRLRQLKRRIEKADEAILLAQSASEARRHPRRQLNREWSVRSRDHEAESWRPGEIEYSRHVGRVLSVR
jgi:hypothetical protein